MANKEIIIKRCAIVLFIIYMCFLVLVIVLKFPTGLVSGTIARWQAGEEIVRMKPQLIPFDTTIFYIKKVEAIHDWFFKNLACNIVMFMPYGFLVPFFTRMNKYKGIKITISGCILSVAIEIFQYVTAFGLMDIDDVILNTLGVALGYGIFLAIKHIIKKASAKKDTY